MVLGARGPSRGGNRDRKLEEHKVGGAPAPMTCLAHPGHSIDSPSRTTFQGLTGLSVALSGVTGGGDHTGRAQEGPISLDSLLQAREINARRWYLNFIS